MFGHFWTSADKCSHWSVSWTFWHLHSSCNPTNVLVPLKDAKYWYEGDLEMVAYPSHRECGCWWMDFGRLYCIKWYKI